MLDDKQDPNDATNENQDQPQDEGTTQEANGNENGGNGKPPPTTQDAPKEGNPR